MATGHSFQPDRRLQPTLPFRPRAEDNTSCPLWGEFYTTAEHVLVDCDELWEPRGDIIDTSSTEELFSTHTGGVKRISFLHKTQALLRPLTPPPRPPMRSLDVRLFLPFTHTRSPDSSEVVSAEDTRTIYVRSGTYVDDLIPFYYPTDHLPILPLYNRTTVR